MRSPPFFADTSKKSLTKLKNIEEASFAEHSSRKLAPIATTRSIAPEIVFPAEKPINFNATTSSINKTARNKENPNRTGVSFFQGAPSLASYDASEHTGPPLQNTNIKNRFKNLPISPAQNTMFKTQNHFASTLVSPVIAELTSSG